MVEHGFHPEHMQYVADATLGLYALAMCFSPAVRRLVRERQDGKCASCEKKPRKLTVHHIVPESIARMRGWTPEEINSPDNGIGLCRTPCHDNADRVAFQKSYDE